MKSSKSFLIHSINHSFDYWFNHFPNQSYICQSIISLINQICVYHSFIFPKILHSLQKSLDGFQVSLLSFCIKWAKPLSCALSESSVPIISLKNPHIGWMASFICYLAMHGILEFIKLFSEIYTIIVYSFDCIIQHH